MWRKWQPGPRTATLGAERRRRQMPQYFFLFFLFRFFYRQSYSALFFLSPLFVCSFFSSKKKTAASTLAQKRGAAPPISREAKPSPGNPHQIHHGTRNSGACAPIVALTPLSRRHFFYSRVSQKPKSYKKSQIWGEVGLSERGRRRGSRMRYGRCI